MASRRPVEHVITGKRAVLRNYAKSVSIKYAYIAEYEKRIQKIVKAPVRRDPIEFKDAYYLLNQVPLEEI